MHRRAAKAQMNMCILRICEPSGEVQSMETLSLPASIEVN